MDDIFLINRERLGRLAGLLRERGIRKKYLVYARVDFLADSQETAAEWAELGLRAVFVGLEAATNPELGAMNKRCTVDVNRRAIAVLRRCGVDTYGSLITQPDYVRDDWDRLRRFIDETGLYYLNVSPFTPLPGTLIWGDYRDSVTIGREAHGLWDLSHVLLPTRMPLREYYRALLGVYDHSCLSPRRAARLALRTMPRVASRKFLRLWLGGLRVAVQFLRAHRHHDPRELAVAAERGAGGGS